MKTRFELKTVMSWVWPIIAAIILFAVVSIFFQPSVVSGSSMEPNYYSGDRFFILKDRFVDEYHYGDVVCIHRDDRILIKSIIGLPGDIVVLVDGEVYVNGVEIDESAYLEKNVVTYQLIEDLDTKFTVGEGEYFVLGDNRSDSVDSRIIGSTSDILGKTFFIFRHAWFS